MITIKVGGQPLYIPKDTTLVLEQHNNSFDIDNITSDIIWTFDIPAKPNAASLDFAHFINISNFKRYQCEISFNGIVISNGFLFIQNVTNEESISCGVILDGLNEEFGNRLLKENDYGPDVQISPLTATLEQHRQNWYNFLTGSLDANSIYKFFLFCCEKFYKQNKDYGYHQNKWSTLDASHDETLWGKFINRLFTWKSPQTQMQEIVYNSADNNETGLKLFNTIGNVSDKLNGYAFSPALRLDWLVRNVFANAGYRVSGDFIIEDHIKQLYIQSMNAMDGDLMQFGLDEFLYLTGGATGANNVKTTHSLDVGIKEVSYEGFKLGNTVTTFNFRLKADVDSLVTGTALTPDSSAPWTYQDEVFMLLVRSRAQAERGVRPIYRCCKNSNAVIKDYVFGDRLVTAGDWPQQLVVYDNNEIEYIDYFGVLTTGPAINVLDNLYGVQLTPSTGNTGASYPDPEQAVDILGDYQAAAMQELDRNQDYIVELVKYRIKTVEHGVWDGDWDHVTAEMRWPYNRGGGYKTMLVRIQRYGELEEMEFVNTIAKTDLANTNTMMNVFDTVLRWKQHVPNVTNGDFIKKICRFFGVSLYVNPYHKEVQLSFMNNIFKAGAIDITPYITASERMAYEPKQYHIQAETVLGTSQPAEDFMLPDVVKHADLDTARTKRRMHVFVKNENAYNVATKDEKTNKFVWETNAGNDHELVIGNDGDEQEEVTADIAVPNMKTIDIYAREKYLCDIESEGNSKLIDDDYTGDFDMILQQYHGRRYINITGNDYGSFYIEDANPTCYDQNGNANDNYLTLAATGKNSVGEKWLRKSYEFQAARENYRFTAELPVDVFWQLYNMQMPQTATGDDEKRWIVVQHRRYIPMKVSYEFSYKDKVKATIECARRHYD